MEEITVYRVSYNLAIQYGMDNWSISRRVFAVIAFIETKSIILTQRGFRVNYGLGRHDLVPSRNSILSRMNSSNIFYSSGKRNGGVVAYSL